MVYSPLRFQTLSHCPQCGCCDESSALLALSASLENSKRSE